MLNRGFSKCAGTKMVLQICKVGWFVFSMQSDGHVWRVIRDIKQGRLCIFLSIALYIIWHHEHDFVVL